MRIPLIAPSEPSLKQLFPRKGGGGGHGGGSSGKGGSGSSSGSKGGSGSSSGSKGGSGSSSGGKGGSSGSSSSGKSQSIPLSGSTGGKKTATTYGSGGGRAVTIPAGQPFAGRTSGGGTRGQVYCSPGHMAAAIQALLPAPCSEEASHSYSGQSSGAEDWGWAVPTSMTTRSVLLTYHMSLSSRSPAPTQYGSPTNASRPGGALTQATFTSNSTNSTFWVVADNATVSALITTIYDNCTLGSNSSTAPTPFSGNASQAQPEQVIQYYRASSVALALDGYNDTAKLTNPNATDVPLPSWMDTQLEGCLNATIAASVPLVSAADMRWQPPVGIIGLVWLLVLFWL